MQSFAVIAISPHSPLTIHFAKDFSTGFENIVALLAQLEQIYRYISNFYKYISTYLHIYILYVNEEKKSLSSELRYCYFSLNCQMVTRNVSRNSAEFH